MSEALRFGIAAAVAFLFGSIPTGLWVGRMARGIDVREHGSGNLGATNVYRTLGAAWGVFVLLVDAGKGAAAVLLARWIVLHATGAAPATSPDLAATPARWAGLIGLAGAVLGHTFSPLAGFRGGKGVAAAAGAWAALAPTALLLSLLIWIAFFSATRIVSLASIAAAVALPFACALTLQERTARNPILWAGAVTSILLLARHRSNWTRLRQGTEKPLIAGSGPADPGLDSMGEPGAKTRGRSR